MQEDEMIKVIINCDDFASSKIFNAKILDLLEKGFSKSTTVMVNRVTAEQEEQLKQLRGLYSARKVSAGLHLESDGQAAMPQIEAQYEKFISIFGTAPSHIDFHRGYGSSKTAFNDLAVEGDRFAKEHGLPARNRAGTMTAKHTAYPALLCKGLAVNLEEVTAFLMTVKDGSSCELVTHPGEYDPESKSHLNAQRKGDYEAVIKLQDFFKTHRNFKNISYLEL